MSILSKYSSNFEKELERLVKESATTMPGRAADVLTEWTIAGGKAVGGSAWKHKKLLATLALGAYLGNKIHDFTRKKTLTEPGQENYPVYVP